MLDSDLARLYGVTTARLNEQVSRNLDRFPRDFAFQLTQQEFTALMSQIAISKSRRGGRRKRPWVFTEQGVAMLSSVLRSSTAVTVNIEIRACDASWEWSDSPQRCEQGPVRCAARDSPQNGSAITRFGPVPPGRCQDNHLPASNQKAVNRVGLAFFVLGHTNFVSRAKESGPFSTIAKRHSDLTD